MKKLLLACSVLVAACSSGASTTTASPSTPDPTDPVVPAPSATPPTGSTSANSNDPPAGNFVIRRDAPEPGYATRVYVYDAANALNGGPPRLSMPLSNDALNIPIAEGSAIVVIADPLVKPSRDATIVRVFLDLAPGDEVVVPHEQRQTTLPDVVVKFRVPPFAGAASYAIQMCGHSSVPATPDTDVQATSYCDGVRDDLPAAALAVDAAGAPVAYALTSLRAPLPASFAFSSWTPAPSRKVSLAAAPPAGFALRAMGYFAVAAKPTLNFSGKTSPVAFLRPEGTTRDVIGASFGAGDFGATALLVLATSDGDLTLGASDVPATLQDVTFADSGTSAAVDYRVSGALPGSEPYFLLETSHARLMPSATAINYTSINVMGRHRSGRVRVPTLPAEVAAGLPTEGGSSLLQLNAYENIHYRDALAGKVLGTSGIPTAPGRYHSLHAISPSSTTH